MFPQSEILGRELDTEHVSWDMKIKDVSMEIDSWDHLAFPCIWIRYIRGSSDPHSRVEAGSNTSTVAL
jgi:hypothetical protein